MRLKILFGLVSFSIFLVLTFVVFLLAQPIGGESVQQNNTIPRAASVTQTPSIPPLPKLPPSYVIPMRKHMFQSFNNCGPASLSMGLSYVGVDASQEELGQSLRPWQVTGGINDDKSVTFPEMARKAQEYGLLAYHRPNGSIELLRQFIAADLPVITRTWLEPQEDIGHYRVVRGYDEATQTVMQDDSLQGKNLTYSYDDFLTIWEKFSYEYLVLVPKDKQQLAERILGENLDEKNAWQKAVTQAESKLQATPHDPYVMFNVAVANYYVGNYQKTVELYEQAAPRLPFRTLWYQIEPILAYQKLGNREKVFAITTQILNNQNRAFSELYLIRGEMYMAEGNQDAARAEFEQAVRYNSQNSLFQEALAKASSS